MPIADFILAMIQKIVPISECVFMDRQAPESQYAFQRGAEVLTKRPVNVHGSQCAFSMPLQMPNSLDRIGLM